MSDQNKQTAQEILSSNFEQFKTLSKTELTTPLEVYHVEDGPESSGSDILVAFAKQDHLKWKIEINTSSKTILGVQPLILLD